MFRIVFIMMLVPLGIKSQSLDSFEIQSVIDFANKIVIAEKKFLDSLSNKDNASAISDTFERMKDNYQKIQNFSHIFGELDRFYPLINELRPTMPFDHVDLIIIEQLDEYLYRIEKLYKSYVYYLNKPANINQTKFNNWIKILTSSEDNDLLSMLEKMYILIINPQSAQDSSFFHSLAEKIKKMPNVHKCGHDLSIQQRLHYLYDVLMLLQIKGFIMNVYANTLQAIDTKSANKSAYDQAEAQVVISIIEYMLAVKSAMKRPTKQVEACDAKEKTPETYASLRGMYEYIVINLIDTNPNRYCTGFCREVNNASPQDCYSGGNYCSERPCKGTLSKCEAKDEVQMCELPADSDRRYEWIREGDKYFGSPSECGLETNIGTERRAKYFYGPHGHTCDVCVCQCAANDSDLHAVRTLSFRPQIAAIEDNMVVAGIRFIQADLLIHIQIKQGKLISHGRIDPSTVAWKKIEKMRYTYTNESVGVFDVYNEENQTWTRMEKRQDYVTVLNDKDDIINFDRIFVEDGYLVTGARWNYIVDDDSRLRFQIEVHATKYDAKSGKLDANDSKWITPQNMPSPSKQYYDRGRERYYMYAPDSPLKAPINIQRSFPNQWHRFGITSFYNDAGQSTAPFFDTQPIQTNPPIAFVGLEIFLRGYRLYGDFITLRLFAVDLSKTWTIELDNDDFSIYKNKFSGEVPYNIEEESN